MIGPGSPGVPIVEITIVIPMLNEAESLDPLFARLLPILEALDSRFEVICVDDGSDDATSDRLRAWHERDMRIKAIRLSRRFGKELALTAGLDHARGAAVIPMDADLQDPPELISEMVALWRRGYDTVLAARRRRPSDSWARRLTAGFFYRAMNRIGDVPIAPDVGDFRLMDRKVADAVRGMRERTRFMKGMFAWPGYSQTILYYDRPGRVTGASKFAPWRLWNFALEGVVSFSSVPLRVWSYIGVATALGALGYAAFIVFITLVDGADVPGYASTITFLLFFNGLIMISLGIIGEYLSRIFLEVKQRPLYLVRETIGFDHAAHRADSPRPG
jgi:glycosyltransferase involved in cell wall biosynthesis